MGIFNRLRNVMGLGLLLAWAAAGCGEDDKPAEEKPSCNVDPSICEEGTLCEQLGEDAFMCLTPVIVRGRVIEARDAAGIADATVVALDANGAARSRVARTAADGAYELPVSVRRTEDGTPISDKITLQVAAADHQAFPTAPRTALAIDLADAIEDTSADAGAEESADSFWVVENAATEVALIELPAAEQGGAIVSGRVMADSPGGVLVLALAGEQARTSAISDTDGAFVLFNVPVGTNAIEGYRAGLAVEPQNLSVPSEGLTDIVLATSTSALSTVTGSVNIVNADGGLTTSVILVVASTFDPNTARGAAPASLRASEVSGSFSISDVPPGRYVVLAAFENDLLVRDPDESIGGTDIAFVDVGPSGSEVSVGVSFKVTEALAVQAPGSDALERVAAGLLELRWGDDSSEDGYELRVYDALGNLVHEDLDVARVTGTASVGYMLEASSYEPGNIYQFRVKSWRAAREGRSYISASEDLRGVFEIAR